MIQAMKPQNFPSRLGRKLERAFGDLGFLGILTSFLTGCFLDPVSPLPQRFGQGFVGAALMLSVIYWVRGPETNSN